MLYADDAKIVPQSPERPVKIMVVVLTVWVTYGFTVSESKAEIM